MFYIHKSKLLRRREALFLQTLPTLIVFIAFMSVTVISWTTAKNTIISEQQQVVQTKNAESSAFIKQRLDSYGDILRGAAGLFDASSDVTRQEWKRYLDSYDISNRYPGLQGVGYVEVIAPEELPAHLERVRAEGFPNYSVFPSSNRDLYTSVVYIEPFNESNLRAFGYDLYSESVRHEAMNKARDSGLLAVSDVVSLIQDGNSNDRQPGFLMFIPVYRGDRTYSTVEERRVNLQGYVYSSFRAHDLISRTIEDSDKNYGIQIYTNQSDSRHLIYESKYFKDIDKQTSKQLSTSVLTLAGINWEVIGEVNPEVVHDNARNRPAAVIWGGIAFSFLVAGFIYLLLLNRSKDLADKEEKGIQEAKDELLALASHQLRTPATGVKQYVGMLREGFAGDLTDHQQELLNKAYESNERQLGTINEMLFVARADAGQLKLDLKEFDIAEMVRDMIEEQTGSFKQKKQKLTLSISKKKIVVRGDKQYLRMAFENILSNASKYTKDGGKIRVTLDYLNSEVVFKVIDNGVGVPPEYTQMLFKKFSRIPNEFTNKVVGSGIGLYLAKQVVDKHKGAITFESAEKAGSIVTITLPGKKLKYKANNIKR